MHYKLIEKLKSRAEAFLDSAFYNAEKQNWDIALFNLEQTLQLWIKAKLLELYGDFPKLHSLKKLLSLLYEKFPELEKVVEENLLAIDLLEDVYISARYLESDYGREEFEICSKLVKRIGEILWKKEE